MTDGVGVVTPAARSSLRTHERIVLAAGHRVEIGSSRVLVDGSVRSIPAAALALLRVLAERDGDVVGRGELMQALPRRGGTTHAVDMAVARLRSALGDKRIIATVVKRGYRLAVD